MKKITSKILKITPKGKDTVYDFTVKDTHRILANNFYTSNCSIQHPDSEAFIDAKVDTSKIIGANVSVKITDDFMESVLGSGLYTQQWPVGVENPTFTKNINSKDLWKKIIHNAWKSAEPGVLFWDTIIRESVPDCYADLGFKTVSTNPCITGNTLIATADGRNAVPIKKLVEEGKDIPVYSTNIETGRVEIKMGRNPRLTGNHKEVWMLTLDDGTSLLATPDHKILTRDLKYIELKDLKPGDRLFPFNSYNSNGYRQISNIGQKMSGGRHRSRRQYREIYEFNNGDIGKNNAIHHINFNKYDDSINNLESIDRKKHHRLHSDNMKGYNNPYYKMSDASKFKFASHPGERNGKYSGKTNDKILEAGRSLYDEIGRFTREQWIDYADKNGYPKFLANDFRFGTFTNFINQVANNHRVKSVEFYGYEDVYNITVDDNHNYHVITSSEDSNYITSSGICIKNCGEIPLCPHDSCRLLSVNLFSYVNNPFTEEASFDFDLFKKHAQIALRMMDDIVDLEIEKIDIILDKIESDPQNDNVKKIELDLWKEIKRKCYEGRRTGVGVTAEGDMLAALGLRYGTKEATNFSVEIHKTFALEVYRSSCQLAVDRGTFTVWNPEREANNPFLLRIKEADPELYNNLMLFGRRNIACLTIAPTGSVSLMTQTTSGIEPAFSIAYKRRRKINPNDKNTKVDFIDESGDCWEEYNVFHPGFKKWLKLNGYSVREVRNYNEEKINELIKISPYYKARANDVDWVEKVRMQGQIQKWVDHSISVTVNLPENATEDLVNDVYITAWKEGCKGCTIYREGSRSGVLITKEQKKEEAFKETFPPKRPESIDCSVLQFQNKGDKWICFIGIIEGKPYEVFSGKLENFPTPSYVENGKIVKSKGDDGLSNYDFHYVDTRGRDIIIPNLNHAFEEKYHDFAKMISGVLRHGMPPQCVVDLLDSLKLDGDLMSTWKAGIKRSLKKFIKDGTKLKGKTCPICGSDQLEYKEGCLTCPNCGNSKCQ
jgi:ribonucleotide reductase alpha subunit